MTVTEILAVSTADDPVRSGVYQIVEPDPRRPQDWPHGLGFETSNCAGCRTPVGGHITASRSNPDIDVPTWTDVWWHPVFGLLCETCLDTVTVPE